MAGWHASKEQIPVEKLGDYEGRLQQFDGYYANFENIPAGFGGPELFKGLPDDACPCEHWDISSRAGSSSPNTDGSEDVVSSGEAYYARPGHVFETLEDCQTIEFSPKEPFEQLLEVVGKNLEAMGES